MLSIPEKVRFLRDIPTFNSLTAEQIEGLATLCETHSYASSSCIFRQGDLENSLYLIVKGRVAIEREVSSATNTVSLIIVGPHECFGELSLIYNIPQMMTATTMQDTVVLQIQQDTFMPFAHQNPDFLLDLNQILSQRLVEAHDRITEVT